MPVANDLETAIKLWGDAISRNEPGNPYKAPTLISVLRSNIDELGATVPTEFWIESLQYACIKGKFDSPRYVRVRAEARAAKQKGIAEETDEQVGWGEVPDDNRLGRLLSKDRKPKIDGGWLPSDYDESVALFLLGEKKAAELRAQHKTEAETVVAARAWIADITHKLETDPELKGVSHISQCFTSPTTRLLASTDYDPADDLGGHDAGDDLGD